MSKWQEYNFPDKLELNPTRRIAEALYLALQERMFVTGEPLEPLTRKTKNLSNYGPSQFCRDFDDEFKTLLKQFHNHTKNNGDFSGLKYGETLWTLDDMMSHLGEDLIDPEKHKLHPKLYLEWARQRYRMMNLLRWAWSHALNYFEPDGYTNSPFPDYPVKTLRWSNYPGECGTGMTHNSVEIHFRPDKYSDGTIKNYYFYKYFVFFGKNEILKKYRFDADIYYFITSGRVPGTRWDQDLDRLVRVFRASDIAVDERLIWDPGVMYYPDELLGRNIYSLNVRGLLACFKFDGEYGFEFLDKEEEKLESEENV